jgi:transmembrane sensor
MQKRYTDYNLQDFVSDENFRSWIKKGKPADEIWTSLLAEKPVMAGVVNEAEIVIQKLSTQNPDRNVLRQAKIWQTIESGIGSVDEKQKNTGKIFNSVYVRAAAVLVLVAGLTVSAWLYSISGMNRFTTVSGEQIRVALPEESVVLLGANSTLEFRKNWKPGKIREVWVDGEAHFEVKHLNKDSKKVVLAHKFVAHIQDKLDVEVLGAVFNVKYRKDKAQVELESGSVKVTDSKMSLLLQPGETVTKVGMQPVARTPTDLTLIYNWTDRELIMDQAKVGDVLETIEDRFNKPVRLVGDGLQERLLDGILPLDKQKDTILALAAVLNAKVQVKDEAIILTSEKKWQ